MLKSFILLRNLFKGYKLKEGSYITLIECHDQLDTEMKGTSTREMSVK